MLGPALWSEDEPLIFPLAVFVRLGFRGRTPIQGNVCYYSAYAHRARFKAWTRAELLSHVGQSDNREKFLLIEQNIISQRRAGAVDMDMSVIPMPNVEVVSSRQQTVEVRAPEEKIVTEAAFKRRTVPPLVLIVRPTPVLDSLHSWFGFAPLVCLRVSPTQGAASRPIDSGQLGRRLASVSLSPLADALPHSV